MSTSPYRSIEKGSPYSPNYRVFIANNDGPISPLHDIPLYSNKDKEIFNMVVEIPRWTNAKMEINMKELLNPIKQDVKKEKVRFVSNSFPHHGYIWNYGAIPQTWEDPNHIDPSTKCKGDGDPIDACEIGSRVAKRAEVIQVKVLGTFALIDEGETDWKLIVIDVNDPLANSLNDITDVDKFFPGLLRATVEWFKIYKIPDGKPENEFAFNGEAKNKAFASNIITQTHQSWKSLVLNEVDSSGISCANITVSNSPYKITQQEARDFVQKAPPLGPADPIDPSVDKWHFIKANN